jgi:YbbR domain-containing protein
MKNKNWSLVIIIFIAALLIAIVFWVYAKRIEHIENKMKSATSGGKTFTTLSIIPPTCQPICG